MSCDEPRSGFRINTFYQAPIGEENFQIKYIKLKPPVPATPVQKSKPAKAITIKNNDYDDGDLVIGERDSTDQKINVMRLDEEDEEEDYLRRSVEPLNENFERRVL